jgi:hypothetical protein
LRFAGLHADALKAAVLVPVAFVPAVLAEADGETAAAAVSATPATRSGMARSAFFTRSPDYVP